MRQRFFLATILTAVALGGCGQKGPLYLPQDPAQPAAPMPGAPVAGAPTAPASGQPSSPATGLPAAEAQQAAPQPGPVDTPVDSMETDTGQAEQPEQQEPEQQEVEK
ncbi:LPS translocon maturation chaperone LptM [Microbulbifer sp. M83]|uniref:LPS translocon maturation chaperone LptM n=1 Tax=Microbulbifer sp. M83 TaxID=3118246 RepID=UPI002FE25DC8